jgi:hypothetical protein
MPRGERKRPRVLVFALYGALALGTLGSCDGSSRVAQYRLDVDPSFLTQDIADEGARATVAARFQAYVHAMDAAKARGWPLAVATLLLGAAIVLFAMRAHGGSGSARTALVQLLVVQAVVSAANHWLLRDVIEAQMRLGEAEQLAEHREASRTTVKLIRAANPVGLAIETVASALVVIGLTRRRSRAFFDSTLETVEER